MTKKNPHAVAMGKKGGSVKSEKKTAAARANAKKPRSSKRPLIERYQEWSKKEPFKSEGL